MSESLSGKIVLSGNQYGKAENRVVRIVRDTARHEIRDLNVSSCLRGDFTDAYLTGDQSKVLPTDTQKQTAYAYAKKVGISSPEEYALALATRSTSPRRLMASFLPSSMAETRGAASGRSSGNVAL